MTAQVGQIVRSDLSGHKMAIVALDERFVYVKRADCSKKTLANPAGGYPVGVQEFAAEWYEVPA